MIIIPMAGESSRFFKAGYNKPKYMLEAHGASLFDHSVLSFIKYFKSEDFVFIAGAKHNAKDFIESRCMALGIENFRIVILEKPTRGQAETVALGIQDANFDENLTIFNIDTIRVGFKYTSLYKQFDGCLEVFEGSGDNWSFVRPLNSNSSSVIETSEKRPISNLCCTGLYYFSSKELYMSAYNDYLDKPLKDWVNGELYIAPLYNFLIQRGSEIRYSLITVDQVIFSGVPQEYLDFKESNTYITPAF